MDRRLLIVVCLVGFSLLVIQSQMVHAVGENYTLSSVPNRAQEGSIPGVRLILNVTMATTPQPYAFAWTVTDPSGKGHTATNQTLATQSSFVLSVLYPRDFNSNPTLNLVGNYTVNVAQTNPTPNPSVARGQFQVGLTNSLSYQRTLPVLVRAGGYVSNDNVTINLLHGSFPVQGFPRWQFADGTGAFSYTWLTKPNTATGDYTVVLNGQNTPPKNPADTQIFALYLANVTIGQLQIAQSTLQRSQTADLSFTAAYPGGTPVMTGTANLRITEPDGLTTHVITASFSSTSSKFKASFPTLLSSQTGAWVATLDENGLNDGYGNAGPTGPVVRGFIVQQASLNVLVSVANKNYTAGSIMAMYVNVTTPGGTSFNSGSVSASLSLSSQPSRTIGAPLSLSYDQSKGEWVGSYIVGPNDPFGLWLIRVNASDVYGNVGYGSTSSLVSIPSSTVSENPLLSYWFLGLVAALVTSVVAGIVLVRRKTFARRVLKIDLEAVSREASAVEKQDFFKEIQSQLRKEQKAADDSASKSK